MNNSKMPQSFRSASRFLRLSLRPCLRNEYPSLCRFPNLSNKAKGHRTLHDCDIRQSGIPLRYIWYLLVGSIGVGAGLTLSGYAKARLFCPRPGTDEDVSALEALADQMDELDIVKQMRSHTTSYGTQSGWLELDLQDNISNISTSGEERRVRPLTEQAMTGIQGLGVQRAFWNSETRELVAVVWIGPRLTGWPGIAHGGAIATIFEEIMSRMIAGPDVSIDAIPTPTSMSVNYARPTESFNLYVLRASFSTPDIPQEQPPTEPAPGKSWLPYWKDFTKSWTGTKPGAPMEISGTLESLDGEVKVRAKGVWPANAIKGS